jgi:glycosyltransferase involved in cell wall biosynthesis
MRILLINHYAGSPEMGMEFRPYYFAKQWVNAGHHVFILAANNSHLRKKKIKINKSFEKQDIDGIKYIWVKTPEYNGNGVSRVLNIFSFVFKSFLNAKKLAKEIKPDIVIGSSTYPIDNYTARRIAKLSGAKHIYEVHDLWPLSPMELGKMSKYHPFILIMQHGENFAYKHCDAVISMLPNTKEHMQNHGLDFKKWHYVPNGINPEEWENPSDIPDTHKNILENLKNENKTIIGYAGGHAISNALDTLIKAAEILNENKKIHFVLVGDGVEKNRLMKKASKLSNFIFLDPIPKNSIPRLLDKMDILVLGTQKSNLYKYGISMNKLMDYMMAGKPIIQYISGYNFIEIAAAGLCCESENPQQLADCIFKLSEAPIEERRQYGENAKKFVLQNHDNKILSQKCLDIFKELTTSS